MVIFYVKYYFALLTYFVVVWYCVGWICCCSLPRFAIRWSKFYFLPLGAPRGVVITANVGVFLYCLCLSPRDDHQNYARGGMFQYPAAPQVWYAFVSYKVRLCGDKPHRKLHEIGRFMFNNYALHYSVIINETHHWQWVRCRIVLISTQNNQYGMKVQWTMFC